MESSRKVPVGQARHVIERPTADGGHVADHNPICVELTNAC